jgi:hypothetical protein
VLADPLRKDVAIARKKIDMANKELKPLAPSSGSSGLEVSTLYLPYQSSYVQLQRLFSKGQPALQVPDHTKK